VVDRHRSHPRQGAIASTPYPEQTGSHRESWQNHLPAPAPRFVDQAEEPFQTNPLHPSWWPGDATRDHIHRASYTDCQTDADLTEGIAISIDPDHLTGRTIGDQEHPRLTLPDPCQCLLVVPLGGSAGGPRPAYPELGNAAAKFRRGRSGNARTGAEEEHRRGGDGAFLGEPSDERSTGHSLRDRFGRSRQHPRGDRDTDAVGDDDIGVLDGSGERGLGSSGHHVFRIEGDDLSTPSIPRIGERGDDRLPHLRPVERIDPDAENREPSRPGFVHRPAGISLIVVVVPSKRSQRSEEVDVSAHEG